MIFLLTSRGTRLKVHQVAEQVLGSLPPVFHHENDGLLLLSGKGKARRCENALDLILRLRKRICCCRYRTLRRGRRLLGNPRAGEREDEHGRRGHAGNHYDFFTAGTGRPAIFTLTEKSVLLVVKYSVFQSSPPKARLVVAGWP